MHVSLKPRFLNKPRAKKRNLQCRVILIGLLIFSSHHNPLYPLQNVHPPGFLNTIVLNLLTTCPAKHPQQNALLRIQNPPHTTPSLLEVLNSTLDWISNSTLELYLLEILNSTLDWISNSWPSCACGRPSSCRRPTGCPWSPPRTPPSDRGPPCGCAPDTPGMRWRPRAPGSRWRPFRC
jgi:hypothetical protein